MEHHVTQFPARYEEVAVMGCGGGGRVWSVRDRITNNIVALKALADDASDPAVQALVREAVMLSSIEGLGMPKVLRFGRLPGSDRPYLVRELVAGESLHALARKPDVDPKVCLLAIGHVADQLTSLHRAALLHGDVKPENIIVSAKGATLVDFGFAAPWGDRCHRPTGLTPRYAAPELFDGTCVTVRTEVFALGATLRDVLEACGDRIDPGVLTELRGVVSRATCSSPLDRHPSADELGSALRLAAGLPEGSVRRSVELGWSVTDLDAAAHSLLSRTVAMEPGAVMVITGETGSGRSTLLRRLAWTLGVEGKDVAWIEDGESVSWMDALTIEIDACPALNGAFVLADCANPTFEAARQRLASLRESGARLVLVADEQGAAALGEPVELFPMPALHPDAAAQLVRRAVPSLPDALVDHVLRRAACNPGKLGWIVRSIGDRPVVSTKDIDNCLIDNAGGTEWSREPLEMSSTVADVERLLDQGQLDEAAALLPHLEQADPLAIAICKARFELGQGNAEQAMETLSAIEKVVEEADGAAIDGAIEGAIDGGSDGEIGVGTLSRAGLFRLRWMLYVARCHMLLGHHDESMSFAKRVVESGAKDGPGVAVVLEARAYVGLLHSYGGDHAGAERELREAAASARVLGDLRVEALVLGSLAMALQRADKLREARKAFDDALDRAETAGDAGTVANTRLNLGVLANIEGDLAQASKHLEAAIDMGRRTGRVTTTRQALLNLAHLDIYLGRYARARSSLASLEEQREQLPSSHRAQLAGMEAELAARTGQVARAAALYASCGQQYEALGRRLDAAEATLEGVLISARAMLGDRSTLSSMLEQAEGWLGKSTSHRALLHLAQGAFAASQHDDARARSSYDAALAAARETGQREWLWRAFDARSCLLSSMGQRLAARRDDEEALLVLEEIVARLPRDLREVFWDDPLRRAVRARHVESARTVGATVPQDASSSALWLARLGAHRSDSSQRSPVSTEERLAKLLEFNRELAREHTLEPLLARIIDHAISLVRAELGFVILVRDGSLVLHTSRNQKGDASHEQFSSGIAERVVATGEPVVTINAQHDERMADYLSVHQLSVRSVACVPIRAPNNRTAGALYVETRHQPGSLFHDELPTLMAFADQAAVAIENAHLISENAKRAEELAKANADLQQAHARLQELFGDRTAQLESTRRDLDATRAELQGHFGYRGLVGTSEKMRRVYALIDRLRDMDIPVLITGESGTGKEVVARALHDGSARGRKRFTGINCGAIPEHLLESELFGHVKGAFTGADRERKGLFRETEGGTLLLDEIGEMPHKMQAGLLRVLQEHVVRPVGGTREEPVSVRVVAATNRNLERMVAEGTFRDDLYYRLHVVEVQMPPLRERTEDVPMLIDHFLGLFAERHRRDRKTVSRAALRHLCCRPWPGNVRQLENALLNAWVMCDRSQLEVEDFETTGPESGLSVVGGRSEVPGVAAMDPGLVASEKDDVLIASLSARDAIEKERLLVALSATGWNRVKAAALCGIPRRTFYRKLRKYGIL